MKVLVVGGGGREHALAWALSREPELDELYAAPGNPGISELGTCVPVAATDVAQLVSFAKDHRIDLTVVGPEAPLALGIVDSFRAHGIRIFGPDRRSAQIETSKSFAKELCSQRGIPTAQWKNFTTANEAIAALDRLGPPWVVKADGLAAGKGTTITEDRCEAEAAIRRELEREPGRIVIEEFVNGWEATFMATVSAGHTQWAMPVLQDYKPVRDGDMGPNTGGMGCYTPVPTATPRTIAKVGKTILSPTVEGLEALGVHFQGVLNLNSMVRHGTEDPYVLEFNARFGDPEWQGVAALVEKGLLAHLYAIAENYEKPPLPRCRQSACVVVVLASKGYPASQSIGDKITLEPYSNENVVVFHAGTAKTPAGELVTSGGRVLNVMATGPTVESARKNAYSVIRQSIRFDGMQYRSDIGAPGRERKLQVPRA